MNRRLRIVYAAGPGDVVNTFRQWQAASGDQSEVSETYSGQFFDVCRELDANAWVRSTCPRRDHQRTEQIFASQSTVPLSRRGGVLYHLSHLWLAARLIGLAIRIRADVVVAGALLHWWSLAPLKLLGIRIIPTLHCAFWAQGHQPNGRKACIIQWLNGWFWRHVADATIAVSPECARQVEQIAGNVKGPIFQSRAQYRPGIFDELSDAEPDERPFRLLYAGRIEVNKGVFQLLDAVSELQRLRPGALLWRFCGGGGALDELRSAVVERGLESVVDVTGKLDQQGMLAAYGWSHVVVVPTTADFAEGLNKVAVEGVLAGRPVLASRYSNALDVLGDAIIEVDSSETSSFCRSDRSIDG